jgi:hypothetical protein
MQTVKIVTSERRVRLSMTFKLPRYAIEEAVKNAVGSHWNEMTDADKARYCDLMAEHFSAAINAMLEKGDARIEPDTYPSRAALNVIIIREGEA